MTQEISEVFDKAEGARLSGDYETARPLLKQCIEACPNEGEYHWAMGHVLMNTGEFDEALETFTKAVQLSPDEPRFLLDLAKMHEMLGEFEEAKPFLEKVLEVAPNSREAAEATKSLSYY